MFLPLIALVAFSPRSVPADQSKQILFERSGSIFSRNEQTSVEEKLAGGSLPTWSPDRSKIVFARDKSLIIRSESGSEQKLWTFAGGEITGLSWGPRVAQERGNDRPGSSILVSLDEGEGSFIYQIVPEQATKPEKLWWLTGMCGFRMAEVGSPAWSPSGRFIAYTVNGDIWLAELVDHVWDIRRLAATADYDGGTGRASHWTVAADQIAWAPDESALGYRLARIGGSGQADLFVGRLTQAEDRWTLTNTQKLDEQTRWFTFESGSRSVFVDRYGWGDEASGIANIPLP